MKQGPSVYTVSERKFLSCVGCQFTKQNLVCSGRHPIWETLCLHPEIGEFPVGESYPPKTPDWCPLVKNPKPEAKTQSLVTCRNCGTDWDLQTIPLECLKHPKHPNTLTELDDKDKVYWLCVQAAKELENCDK